MCVYSRDLIGLLNNMINFRVSNAKCPSTYHSEKLALHAGSKDAAIMSVSFHDNSASSMTNQCQTILQDRSYALPWDFMLVSVSGCSWPSTLSLVFIICTFSFSAFFYCS